MKKYLSLIFVLIFVLVSVCACGGNTTGETPADDVPPKDVEDGSKDDVSSEPVIPDYLKHELTDKNSMSLENSPVEFSANADAANFDLGLDINVTNANGEKVLLDDVLFVLEKKSANGVGKTVLEPIYDGENMNVRLGSKLVVTPADNGVKVEHMGDSGAIRLTDYYHFDTTKEYVIVLDIDDLTLGTVKNTESNTPGWEMYGSIKWDTIGNWTKYSNNLSWMPWPDFDAEGRFTLYASDMIRSHLLEMDAEIDTLDVALIPVLYIRGNGTTFTLKDFRLVECEPGLQNAQNSADATYYTDGIESVLKFNNGTGVKTFDYYSNEYTVARKLTLTDDGLMVIGGKVNGNVAYDGSTYTVTATYNGIEYAVTSNKTQCIEFYDSEEDMYNGNATEFPTENTKYWVSYCPDLKIGESVYMAVAANTENSDIDLISTARYAIDAYYRIEK